MHDGRLLATRDGSRSDRDRATDADAVAAVLAPGSGLTCVHQPIVELPTGTVVAHEALLRPPPGSGFDGPLDLFAAARAVGRLEELDWRARALALAGVGRDGARPTVFVNVEPDALGAPVPEHLVAGLEAARERVEVVVELTERALVHDPARVLALARRVREWGWRVAIDDVGADPASLALVPLVAPDVIKVDLRLVQHHPDAAAIRILTAVQSQAEAIGATVVAEGIETDEHLGRAVAMGADLGQGFLFGRPTDAATHVSDGGRIARLVPPAIDEDTPASAMARAGARFRRVAKAHLLPVTRHLEDRALVEPEPTVVLATLQHRGHLSGATRARYRHLGGGCALVAVLGEGVDGEGLGVARPVPLGTQDPLTEEWVVAVVSPHFHGALVARDLGDGGADHDRRFDFLVTHDRDLVLDVARRLIHRLPPVAP